MTNIWTAVTKQIEVWGQAAAIHLTAGTGSFSLAGVAANLLAPLGITAGTGTFIETGNNATLTYSGATGGTTTGGLLSLTVADATPIDPVSSIGASGSGWVAIVTLKGLTSLAGTAVPSALTLSVSDPGFDNSGNVTTVTRTITGVAHLRRQYPNGNSKMISTDGTNLTLYITLDDWIYSGTTIVSATIGATFYPSCTAGNAASKLNLSATAYTKPLFGWINPQQESSGATFAAESVAFHCHATAGQQVACIKYSASDGTTTSPVVTTSATALSSRITQGNIPEVWKATIDMSTLAQATMATVNAKVYPWLGDSTAVLDLSADGVAWPTSLPITKLRVWNDRTGGYGGGFAYVKVGAVGGAVSSVAATAAAAPFPTIAAALNAIQAWNNTNKGHNDFGGGTVRLMDTGGANTTFTINEAPSNAFGQAWCNVEKDPASAAVISVTWASQQTYPQLLRWRNLTITQTSGVRTFVGQNEVRSLFCMDNCTLANANTGVEITFYDLKYLYNLSIPGAVSSLNNFPNSTSAICISAATVTASSGADVTNSGVGKAHVLVGNTARVVDVALSTSDDGNHGRIIYNNYFRMAYFNNTSANTLNSGVANVQNQYETDTSTGSDSMNMFADSDMTTIANYIEYHNTAVGERASRLYNDIPADKIAPSGVTKIGSSKYSVWDNYNCKTDTFNTGAGSVGNWAYIFSVGNVGNVSLFGAVGRTIDTLPDNDNAGGYLGSAWLPSSLPDAFSTPTGLTTQAAVMALFTNYTVQPQTTPVIGGNYKPLSTATVLKNRVPAGKHVLTYDLAGIARRTDGTGAAGAFESA